MVWANTDVNAPDQATREPNGVLTVSGAHGGGLLILTFTAAPATGAVAVWNDAGCDAAQRAFFYLPREAADGGEWGGAWLTAQLTAGDGGVVPDGGQRTSLLLTETTTARWLGCRPLPNRSFDLVLP